MLSETPYYMKLSQISGDFFYLENQSGFNQTSRTPRRYTVRDSLPEIGSPDSVGQLGKYGICWEGCQKEQARTLQNGLKCQFTAEFLPLRRLSCISDFLTD